MLWKVLHSICNMQYALNMQYAGSRHFGIVNKAEIDVFLELACFFHDAGDVGNLICGSSAFSKTSLKVYSSIFNFFCCNGEWD